jgi:hypothetical protein
LRCNVRLTIVLARQKTTMTAIAWGLILIVSWSPSLLGQERDPALDQIELALQEPPSVLRRFDPVETATPTTFGIFTLVPPTGRGEILRVTIPIGEVVSRAFKANSTARRRRQEATIRREVESALQRFREQQLAPKH